MSRAACRRYRRRSGRQTHHEVADRAGIRSDGGETAGVQSTVGTGDVHLSFTAEETVILAGGAVIRIEAGFEDEANLRVADVFRTLQTPAGAGVTPESMENVSVEPAVLSRFLWV